MNVLREERYVWRIKRENGMRVDAVLFSDSETVSDPQFREAMKQLVNVSKLPGVVKEVYGMPDIHWGYGFPIGGVAAFDPDEGGIISPGAVGFDINCGVRLMRTDLEFEEVKEKIKDVVKAIYSMVPVGVGSRGEVRLGRKGLRRVCEKGARWAVEAGYGFEEDLEYIEDNGRLEFADPNAVSKKAYERGEDELGTLGGGNHFIEVQKVERIFDPEVARVLGLFEGQIVVMVHTGSRGFGHQVATDYIKTMRDNLKSHNADLPDKQLINAPFQHELGRAYFSAMACAANYAFANRQIIGHLVRKAFWKVFGGDVNLELVYDLAHNIAKLEEHEIDGVVKKLVVHRKGATRSFGPGNEMIPEKFRDFGQPVLIPGDMGTASYVMVGTEKAQRWTFGSSAHGAGRMLGRREALRRLNYSEVL